MASDCKVSSYKATFGSDKVIVMNFESLEGSGGGFWASSLVKFRDRTFIDSWD